MDDRLRERLRLVIYLYHSGASAQEVAEAIGVSKQRVLQLLRGAGVERRKCGNVRRGDGGKFSTLGVPPTPRPKPLCSRCGTPLDAEGAA